MRRVACISTSRADAGIYEPLLAALSADGGYDVALLAGGTHLSGRFGGSFHHLPVLPRVSILPVEHHVEGDAPGNVALGVGRAVAAFSFALEQVRPDLAFVLGDRAEMLAAALAALVHRVPIAHLHGGDVSYGAYDEQCRHAMTKLAHVHFCALPGHADRIAAMGEERWRIHTVGAPALDAVASFLPEPAGQIGRRLGLDFLMPSVVVLFHPETLSPLSPRRQVAVLTAALTALPPPVNYLIIGPNADPGRDAIEDAWAALEARPGTHVVRAANLTQRDFWSCLCHARVLVGNSSAGIIESASFKLPVVNVGDRQAGRFRAANVIDAALESDAITSALRRALDPDFRASLADLRNSWGDGHAAKRILDALAALPDRQTMRVKKWSDARPAVSSNDP